MRSRQEPRPGSPIVWPSPDGLIHVELGVTDTGLYTVWEHSGGHSPDGEAPIPFATYDEAAALATLKAQLIRYNQTGK